MTYVKSGFNVTAIYALLGFTQIMKYLGNTFYLIIFRIEFKKLYYFNLEFYMYMRYIAL